MSRWFCFVIWGPTPPDYKTEFMTYLTYQREAGLKKGRRHYQGFVSFHFPQTRECAARILDPCKDRGLGYLEPARSLQAGIRYAQKHSTRILKFVELGKRPTADRTC